MSSRQSKLRLAGAIRQTLTDLEEGGGKLTTTRLTDAVMEEFPEICESEKERLFRNAIASIARGIMKETKRHWEDDQKPLFGELPSRISLPPSNGAKDAEWHRIELATFRQLEAHILLLSKQVADDTAKLRTLRRLHRVLAPLMADDHADEPIGPWLRIADEDAA